MGTILTVFESPDHAERVLIVRRRDGTYTYQRQWFATGADDPDSPLIEVDEIQNGKWGPLGPPCGIYDSETTAEIEATQRVPWLRK